MRKWLVALVAAAAFGAGWIANDVAEPDCTTTRGTEGRYVDETVEVCRH